MLPEASVENSATDYDSATSFLGKWGRFQRRVFFLLCLSVVPDGLTAFLIVFLADTPAHRCLLPAHLNLSAAWRNSSIPLEEDASGGGASVPSRCSRYKLEHMLNYSERGLLPGVDVNLSSVPTEGCVDGWQFDHSVYTSTIVTEWNLVCGESWKNPLTTSIFFCGVLVGALISGQLSDRFWTQSFLHELLLAAHRGARFGRKIMMFATIALQAVTRFIQVFSPNWIIFCALYFIVGMGQVSKYLVAFVLGTEVLGFHIRTIFSTAGVTLFFGAGYMLLPLFAFYITNWRMLLLALMIPSWLCLPFWWFVPESPRWLLSQGRIEEAEAIIREAAEMNNVEPPAVIFTPLQNGVKAGERRTYNICDLLRSPNIRWTSITLWVIWNTVNIAYFALSLNTANLHGNAYFNCFLSATVEMPAYVLSWVMFRWCSRRMSVFASLSSVGLLLFIIQLVPAHLVFLSITIEMMGKFAVTTAFSIVYAYTAELCPTVLRNTAVGACSMASRIGSITAPFFIYLRTYSISLPYILMGSLTTMAGLLSLLLPESFGIPLPETISHMQQFPGCCREAPCIVSPTKEEEKAAEIRTLVRRSSSQI